MIDAGAIAQWGATGVIAIALIVSWVRNGRSRSEEWGSLKTDVANIKTKLEDPNHGLGAIKKSVDEQKIHCASMTSKFEQKIYSIEERGKRKKK